MTERRTPNYRRSEKKGVRRKKNDPFQIRFAHVRDEAPIAAVEREGSKAKFEQVFSNFGA